MRIHSLPTTLSGRLSMAALSATMLFATACSGGDENDDGTDQQEVFQIEISLKEFTFQPETIRIPAGRPVTLVITNDGAIPHEFMVGREAEDGHFEYDLFEGLEVSMMGGEMEMAEDHDEADGDEDAEDHADGDDDHGTMIMAAANETVTMSFTLPESLRGTWSAACFLPGHFEAGMRGTLIVE